jgi:hypothetical protein
MSEPTEPVGALANKPQIPPSKILRDGTVHTPKPRWRIRFGPHPLLGSVCFLIEKRVWWWWWFKDWRYSAGGAMDRLTELTRQDDHGYTTVVEVTDDGKWTYTP